MRLNCCVFAVLIYCLKSTGCAEAALFDWFWNGEKSISADATGTHATSVPFESKTEDEKFLEEALKFTDIMKSSALDICQHNVVLKIKTSCSSMTEEELAKLSVNLLNCQSQVDGRKIFPCTDTMTLKECTVKMDGDMWNAYHMMNNRARAVCMAAHRAQFQALSEMTVNKLLSTAQHQIKRMAELQKGQEELEAITADAMAVVREGNVNIMLEQDKIKAAQQSVEMSVMKNLKELSRERSLIAAGNRELDIIKRKIDETNSEIALQSLERIGNHQQVISDLTNIQLQAEAIFKKIDESTQKALVNHHVVAKQFEETLRNLRKINETVGYLTALFTFTHGELETRIEWIKSFLGESGEELHKLTSAVLHVAYLLMGMLIASFLHLPFITRVALVTILPLNLMLIYESKSDVDLFQITVILVIITLVNMVVNGILSLAVPQHAKYFITNGDGSIKSSPPGAVAQPIQPSLLKKLCTTYPISAYQWVRSWWRSEDVTDSVNINDSFVSSTGREPEDNNETMSPAPAPASTKQTPRPRPNRSAELVSRWLEHDHVRPHHRSPSPATSIRSGSPRNQCRAHCRTGRACRNMSTPGRDYCRVHETGSSVYG